jgi:S1-C subfamily serine protease
MVRVVVASAKGGGTAVKRPWLGARLQPLTPDIAEGLGLKRAQGVLVAGISPGSPAARAGLKSGDVIVSVDGQQVDDPNAFEYRFGTKALGGNAQLGVLRSGKDLAAMVALQTAPETPREEILLKGRSPFLGAKVGNLSPAVADELRLDPGSEGVVILDIGNGSPAQRYGFKRGDVVVSVNGERITKSRDLERVTGEGGRVWKITITRDGQQVSVVLGG